MATNSIWHTTTLQSLKNNPQHGTSVVGQKRNNSELLQQAGGDGPGTKRLAPPVLKLSRAPPRLTASTIEAHPDGGADGQLQVPTEYTQRQAFAPTPTAFHDPFLSLAHPAYGLPGRLVANFAKLGIKTIYPWQKQCLLGPGLLRAEKNLVYSAPTGGGKSLVADVLMLKRVLDDRDAKAILVLPYVALVQEKVRWLRNVVDGISRQKHLGQQSPEGQKLWAARADKDTVRVVGFYGGNKIRSTWADFDIAVCTMEKANSLVNTAIEDCSITKLKAIVLDECHMIDDGHRGYILELMTTKLLCIDQDLQIVAMSATLTVCDFHALLPLD